MVDHFQAMQPKGQPITWARFTAALRRTHVPAGVMALKKREFRELKQGNRSVMEYLHEFNNLARYALEDVREDEKKQEKFLAGMDPELSMRLVSGDYPEGPARSGQEHPPGGQAQGTGVTQTSLGEFP
jgi:Retrotransposon gag protein.